MVTRSRRNLPCFIALACCTDFARSNASATGDRGGQVSYNAKMGRRDLIITSVAQYMDYERYPDVIISDDVNASISKIEVWSCMSGQVQNPVASTDGENEPTA